MSRSLLKKNATSSSQRNRGQSLRQPQVKRGHFLYDQKSKEFVEIKDGFICGRDEGNLKFPQDESMSRKHCAFTVTDADIFIMDLGSTNGTLLNSLIIKSGFNRRLYVNDLIVIGGQRFIFTNQNQRVPGSIQDCFKEESRKLLRRKGSGLLEFNRLKYGEIKTGLLVDVSEFRRIKIQETLKKLALVRKNKPICNIKSASKTKTAFINNSNRKGHSVWFLGISLILTAIVGAGIYFQAHSESDLIAKARSSLYGTQAKVLYQLMNPEAQADRTPSFSKLQTSDVKN